MKIKPNAFNAWSFLTFTLTLHVLDEALNDFYSIFYSKLIAGVYSSPLLLVGSVYLIWSTNLTLKLNHCRL